MSTYKIKSILDHYIIIEYRIPNGSLREITVGIQKEWNKQKIEEEIARQKNLADQKEIKLDLAQYFYKGEELEFVDIISEEERIEQMNKQFEEEHKLLVEEENQRFLNQIIEYRNTEIDYGQVRWYSYPSIEEQLDALYWMRQGIMEPIQKIDAKIAEIKQAYPKNECTNLTCGDLDTMFADQRPTDYLDELRKRNIQADFLE
jgi:hypothetical protein